MSSFLVEGMFRIVGRYFRTNLYLEFVTSGLGAVGFRLNHATGHWDVGAAPILHGSKRGLRHWRINLQEPLGAVKHQVGNLS